MKEEAPPRDTLAAACVAGLVALALVSGAQRGHRDVRAAARGGEVTTLSGPLARYTFHPASGRLEIATIDGASRVDLEMSLVVDGVERPLVMRRADVQLKDKNTLAGELPIELGEERATGTLELRMDPGADLVTASLTVTPEGGSAAHTYALRTSIAPEGRAVFVPGVGEVADVSTVEGTSVTIDDDLHPFALVSTQGALTIAEQPPDADTPGARPRLVVSAKSETAAKRARGAAPAKPARLDMSVLVGATSQRIWGRLSRVLHAPVARVTGVVTGTKERAHVIALDEESRPQLRAIVDGQGRFSFEAPASAIQWYAQLEALHTSAPVRFTPGTAWDLRLDVSPGGELRVRMFDVDTKAPIVARLLVHGIEGTLDPSFGPDYRASGAGPLMDVLEGEVHTPLPAGRYRVSATKGVEYSIDAEEVEIVSGRTQSIELGLRHVVSTPGMVGCDLHVHARPSFDTPVTPEDRVLSLVSAGIDFAVPTEHNTIGDYTPAVELLRLDKSLAHVPGVEVTTYNPRFGHFGVFPWTPTGSVPPYRNTSAAAIIASARRGDPTRVVQINHPRLAMGIGYFNIVEFDPKSGRIPPRMRTNFDTLEVYNGYDLGNRPHVERVLEDWFALLNLGKRMAATGSSDSHRIQYQWAGYPRTYALVDPRAAGDTGQPIDVREIVAAIKRGKSFVTSGPIVELELGRAKPGDEIPRGSGTVTGKLRVRAAPWVDVTSVELVAGAPAKDPFSGAGPGAVVKVYETSIASRPTKMGDEDGTLDEAQARTTRLQTDVSVRLPEGARWVVAIVRGERTLDDALPFMPVQPLAFTNPIWIGR